MDCESTSRMWRTEHRTTETVLKTLYPGVDLIEMRRRRDGIEDEIRHLETRIQRTNWTKGEPPLAELLREAKRVDDAEENAYTDARRYIRLYEDQVDEGPNVKERIEKAEELLRRRADLSLQIQRLNWEVELE